MASYETLSKANVTPPKGGSYRTKRRSAELVERKKIVRKGNVPSIPVSDLQLRANDQNARVDALSKANPLVPLGLSVTVLAIGGMMYNFARGDSVRLNTCARWRVGAQGFTVLAFLVGNSVSRFIVERGDEQKDAAKADEGNKKKA